jgi:hypothetical protein
MAWQEVTVTQREWVRAPEDPVVWDCKQCGFHNRPRPVPNSLNTIPADHKIFDASWRESHCEQCGAERP